MLVELVLPTDAKLLDQVVSDIVGKWGGCTVSDNQKGYWTDPDGKVVSENVQTLSVDTGDATLSDVARWFDVLSDRIRWVGQQHTVYYRMSVIESRWIGPDTLSDEGRAS